MTEAVNIRRNSFFSFVSAIARVAANFVLFWLIARYYSEEIFGQFTFAQSLSTNFLFLADFGFDMLLITEVSRNRNQSTALFRKYYSLKLIFSLLALFSMWFIALFISLSFQAKLLIMIFSFFMIFSALTNFLFALFKGYEK
ncbi:MAG: oligosaccharide flippase family protein, partial [Ignavibacteria bacterium]|nr:oligosaccharide flippase family protein [Ignavibacteria bacterium]